MVKKILQGIAETIFESIPDDLKTKVTTDVLDKVLRDNNIEDYIITEIFLILSKSICPKYLNNSRLIILYNICLI